MAVVTQTDRPKSVCNRCVIDVLVAVFFLLPCIFDFSVGVRACVIGLNHVPFFSLIIQLK